MSARAGQGSAGVVASNSPAPALELAEIVKIFGSVPSLGGAAPTDEIGRRRSRMEEVSSRGAALLTSRTVTSAVAAVRVAQAGAQGGAGHSVAKEIAPDYAEPPTARMAHGSIAVAMLKINAAARVPVVSVPVALISVGPFKPLLIDSGSHAASAFLACVK